MLLVLLVCVTCVTCVTFTDIAVVRTEIIGNTKGLRSLETRRDCVTSAFVLFVLQEFRQKVMLGTPFLVIWLVGFIADLDIDSWLIKGLMYGGVWATVQFLSK
jgi:hypothetical protein